MKALKPNMAKGKAGHKGEATSIAKPATEEVMLARKIRPLTDVLFSTLR
jgi:hypothetical protein